ncbi:hypothetical protein PTSG_05298 [Salpingoeca rosetta]|uniref:Actin-fragmin kinase catalytic domain-containing protein n=1 Tax=Salpingoeca rosetta (strain ATCC 50818 / BSB-021) TaxID=946362 RepID=F2UA13_SALR5|nr:uncharacterized protein PTSG_05298 [Salpingoeca rosetta]EGD73588.1 hypothetical protein PTSG_05298 [Salpingoeca rosetta]|eukprot:XP_004993870.1 hypothetical protein PTSG_05298 [Salpingoeca rosetta]
MPSFPCDECKETFSNTVLLKRHKLSGQCKGHIKALEEEKARRNRPLYNFDFFNDGKPAPLDVKLLRHPGVAGVHHSAGGLGVLPLHAHERACSSCKPLTSSSLLWHMIMSRTLSAIVIFLNHTPVERRRVQSAMTLAPRPGAFMFPLYHGDGSGTRSYTLTLLSCGAQNIVRRSGEHGAAVLKSLGAVIAMDVLLNNFDRTPFVWSHEGNANNIMFARDSPTAFAIDNTSAAITDDEGREAYCSKVTTAVKEAINQTNGPHIKAVVTFLETWTGLTLTDEQRMAIQTGLVEACERISKQLDVTAAWQSMMQVFSEETSIGAANTDAINLSFIQQVQAAVTAGLEADL